MNNAVLQQAGNLEKAHNEMMLDRDSLARENDRLRDQVKKLLVACKMALIQWPAAHMDQPRIIGQIKAAIAHAEKGKQ